MVNKAEQVVSELVTNFEKWTTGCDERSLPILVSSKLRLWYCETLAPKMTDATHGLTVIPLHPPGAVIVTFLAYMHPTEPLLRPPRSLLLFKSQIFHDLYSFIVVMVVL